MEATISKFLSNQSSFAAGGFRDKQWVAVNHVPGSRYQDHVYAMWSVFNGHTSKIKVAVSRDRGQTFSKPKTITAPQETGPSTTFIYPSVDAAGPCSWPWRRSRRAVRRQSPCMSPDRSTTPSHSVRSSRSLTTDAITGCCLPNTTFRDGIIENFAASPTYPGHLYLTWESGMASRWTSSSRSRPIAA